jgi:hypothetical protein
MMDGSHERQSMGSSAGRMGKKLDPIENAGFQQTCLSCAGQR